jgi:lysozyme
MWKEALIALGLSASPADHPPAPCLHDCEISQPGIDFIKEYEGFYPYIYKDSAGYDTVGFGHLVKAGEKIKTPLLGEDAEKLFKADLAPAVNAVNRYVSVPLYDGQVGSLTSWTFNLGVGALKSSTMLKKINAAQHKEVPAQIKRWNKAGGKVIKGLERRREAEAALYEARWY